MKWLQWTLWVPLAACNVDTDSAGQFSDSGGSSTQGGDGQTMEEPDYGLEGDECSLHENCESTQLCDDGYCVDPSPIPYCDVAPTLVETPLPETMDADVFDLFLVDLDEDGIDDLVAGRSPGVKGLQILLGPGSGTPTNIGNGIDVFLPAATGDANGDGHVDVWVGTGDGQAVMLGDGAGGLGDPIPTGLEGAASGRMRLDTNGDGFADAAVTSERRAEVWQGDGTGVLTETISRLGFEQDLNVAILGDVRGDADAELIYLDDLARLAAVDVAADQDHLIEPAGVGWVDRVGFAMADVSGDARPDLLRWYGNVPTLLTIWLRTDAGLTPPRLFAVPDEARVQGTGDLDGNGPGEIVLTSEDTLYIVFDAATDDRCLAEYDTDDFLVVTLGDFDGDGLTEIVWSDQTRFVVSELE